MLIIADLDDTLIYTRKLKPLRDKRNWRKVYENFNKTYLEGEVRRTFENLLNRYEIIIVTSSPKPYAKKLLEHHNFLTRCSIVGYHDTTYKKPHTEPYEKALYIAKSDFSKVIVFGDDEKDIKPGLDLGFLTVGVEWYVEYRGNIKPHYKIKYPSEINNVI